MKNSVGELKTMLGGVNSPPPHPEPPQYGPHHIGKHEVTAYEVTRKFAAAQLEDRIAAAAAGKPDPVASLMTG